MQQGQLQESVSGFVRRSFTLLAVLIVLASLLSVPSQTDAKPEAKGERNWHRNGPPDEMTTRSARRDLEVYGKLRTDWKDGRRSDQDGYLILRNLLHAYAALQLQKTPEAEEVSREFKKLHEEHPTWWKELSELSNVANERKAREERRSAALRKWKPKDKTPQRVYFNSQFAAVKYQYRIEFSEIPQGKALPRRGESGLAKRPLTDAMAELKGGVPRKITFSRPISVAPDNPRSNNSYIIACSRPIARYMSMDQEESEVIGVSNDFTDTSAEVKDDRCIVVGLDGRSRVEIPLTQQPPDHLFQPIGVTPDGSSALILEGTAHWNPDDEDWDLEKCLAYLIWTRKDGLQRKPFADLPPREEWDLSNLHQSGYTCPY